MTLDLPDQELGARPLPVYVVPKAEAPTCSWWIGLDRQRFAAVAAKEFPRMAGSRMARVVSGMQVVQ